MVSHHHLLAALVETRVDVKGNVVASQKVHGEPGRESRDADIFWTLCAFVSAVGVNEGQNYKKSILHFSVWLYVAEDGHHHLVIHTSCQIQVVWHTLNARRYDYTG